MVVFLTAVFNRFGRWRDATALRGCSGVAFIIVGIVSVVRRVSPLVRSSAHGVKSKLCSSVSEFDVTHGFCQ
jgi:hypothetical protein